MSERNESHPQDQAVALSNTNLRVSSQESVIEMAKGAGLVPALYVKTIMASCFKGKQEPTAEQFLAFMLIAREHGLNPILKQIHAFPQDGGIQPIIGVDGWLVKINEHPQFDGMDEFRYGEDDYGKFCETTFYRKDRSHPTVIREYLKECKRNTEPWNKMERRMLRNRVICQGGRVVFGVLSGFMETDEGEKYFETTAEVVKSDEAKAADFAAQNAKTRELLGIAAPPESSGPATPGASQDGGAAVDPDLTPEGIMVKIRTCRAVPHLENIRKKYRSTADNLGFLPEFEKACDEQRAELRGDPVEVAGDNGGEVK